MPFQSFLLATLLLYSFANINYDGKPRLLVMPFRTPPDIAILTKKEALEETQTIKE